MLYLAIVTNYDCLLYINECVCVCAYVLCMYRFEKPFFGIVIYTVALSISHIDFVSGCNKSKDYLNL